MCPSTELRHDGTHHSKSIDSVYVEPDAGSDRVEGRRSTVGGVLLRAVDQFAVVVEEERTLGNPWELIRVKGQLLACLLLLIWKRQPHNKLASMQ